MIAIPIVLFSGRFYIEMMNGMRQMIVACFFVYASKWIVEKKFFRYCLFVWIAHYFHNSALMLLPIYFIPQKLVLADKQKYTLFIFLLCFLLGQTASFQSFSSFIGDYANLVGYNDYVNVVNDILNDSNKSETMAMGITMISYFLMSFFVILFSDKLRIRFRDDIKCFDIWYNYSYIYSCGFFLFCNVSHIFIRPLLYFELFLMYMLSLIIIYCWEGLNNVRLLKFCSNKSFYVFFVSILWVGLVWTLFKNSNLPDESLSYKMIFNHTI